MYKRYLYLGQNINGLLVTRSLILRATLILVGRYVDGNSPHILFFFSVGHVDQVLQSMSDDEFKKNFQRHKPSSDDELIFYCQSGRRSCEALDLALKLGFRK